MNYIFFWIQRELEIMIIEQAVGTANKFNFKNERPLFFKKLYRELICFCTISATELNFLK